MARTIWVAIFDLHWPFRDRKTVAAIFDYISKNRNRIAGIILGGDVWDCQEASHHTVGKPLTRPRGALLTNRLSFDKEFLKPLEAMLHKDIAKVFIEGNHDVWLRDAVQTSPELDGLLDHFEALNMAGRGWKYFPLGHGFNLTRQLVVIHGESLGGAQPCKKALHIWGERSVVFGHLHTPSSASQISPVDQHKKFMAYCSPIAGAVDPAYMKSRPSGWQTGMMLIELHANKRDSNIYPVIIAGGKFSIGGVTYSGKKKKTP